MPSESTRFRRLSTACAALLALITLAPVGAQAEPLQIRAGWINTPASLIPVLFAKPGVAKHQGISYNLEAIHFSSSPQQITGIASGQLEIATLGFSTFSIAILNAGLTDLKVVADETQDGVAGHYSIPYMVRKDSPIQTVEDLKGKVVASNGIGSGVDISMRAVLAKHGLVDKREFTTVEVQFPNMRAVLAEGKADLIVATLPFTYDPEMEKIGRPLFHQRDAFGGPAELSFWTARAGFIEKNRAVMVDLLEDTVRAIRWYIAPENRAEAIQYLAAFTKLPPDRFEGWLFDSVKDYYRDPDVRPNLAALKQNIEVQHQLGFIKADIDPEKYADLSMLEEAVKRLK
jgi:NitT/TauT family transport system substrate-binding protein